MEQFSVSNEAVEFPTNSRLIPTPQIWLQTAETLLRRIWRRPEAKLSRAAFGGSTFDSAVIAGITRSLRYIANILSDSSE